MCPLERSIPTNEALPGTGEARRTMARLRRRLFQDAEAFRDAARAAVRLAMPPARVREDALVEALVGVCLQTVLDPYDAGRAERMFVREAPRDPEEALECLCDWTVRRELGRIRRGEEARRAPNRDLDGRR